jgi:hypothetical protein
MGDDTVPSEAARLQAFAGDWVVSGALEAEGSTSGVSGRWHFEPASDGWGVHGRMETTIDGLGTFEEEELIGYDPTDEAVHMFSMNRFAVRDHRGGWVTEEQLEVEFNGRQEGRTVSEIITIRFLGADRMEGRVIERADGELVVKTDLTLSRSA